MNATQIEGIRAPALFGLNYTTKRRRMVPGDVSVKETKLQAILLVLRKLTYRPSSMELSLVKPWLYQTRNHHLQDRVDATLVI